MSLASEMKNLAESVRDTDKEFIDGYNKYIELIRKKAMEGKREISWYDNPFAYKFDNDGKKHKEMLKQKLSNEGFRHVYGYQIGKPTNHSMSQYIVW